MVNINFQNYKLIYNNKCKFVKYQQSIPNFQYYPLKYEIDTINNLYKIINSISEFPTVPVLDLISPRLSYP